MISRCHTFKDWVISETKSHILKLEGPERKEFEENAKLPMYPDMIFDKNKIVISHNNEIKSYICELEFNVADSLKEIGTADGRLKVAAADQWQEANAHILRSNMVDAVSPCEEFDWTYTTRYSGTLHGPWSVRRGEGSIDYELLKRREPILFSSEVCLFEDELGDNGCAQSMVRVRVMPSGFFLLHRFFLRVDGRLVRVYDTRLCGGEAALCSGGGLVREVRLRETGGPWKDSMAGVGITEAEACCDRTVLQYSETLIPTEMIV